MKERKKKEFVEESKERDMTTVERMCVISVKIESCIIWVRLTDGLTKVSVALPCVPPITRRRYDDTNGWKMEDGGIPPTISAQRKGVPVSYVFFQSSQEEKSGEGSVEEPHQ
jgi:hypothetical protein